MSRFVKEVKLAPGEKLPWHTNNPYLIAIAGVIIVSAILVYLLH